MFGINKIHYLQFTIEEQAEGITIFHLELKTSKSNEVSYGYEFRDLSEKISEEDVMRIYKKLFELIKEYLKENKCLTTTS